MEDRPVRRRPVALAILTAVAIAAGGAGALGCGGSDDSSTSSTAAPKDVSAPAKEAPAAVDKPECKDVKPSKAKPATYQAPTQTVKRGEKLTAVVKTNCGSFRIALDAKRFQTAVNSFVFLAEKDFYDGLGFDEAAAGTFLHGGDPPGDAVGPGYTVVGKIPEGFIYRTGVVAMARFGEERLGRAGSQFFVSLGEPWIDISGIYPPIGTVDGGLGVLKGITQFGAQAAPGPRNTGVIGPIGELSRPVAIEDVSIERG